MSAVVIRSPRWRRVLDAMAVGCTLTTWDVLRLAGCTNASALLGAIRRRLGVELAATMRPHVDRDGRATRIAVYALLPHERRRVLDVLRGGR